MGNGGKDGARNVSRAVGKARSSARIVRSTQVFLKGHIGCCVERVLEESGE